MILNEYFKTKKARQRARQSAVKARAYQATKVVDVSLVKARAKR